MPSVIIVEDNTFLRETLARFLKSAGFEVRTMLATAEEALEQLQYIEVDIVLVDISLPGMSGIELVNRLRQSHPHVPCLILSIDDYSYLVRSALEQGARGYVTKREPDTILEGIRQVLNGKIYVSEDVRS